MIRGGSVTLRSVYYSLLITLVLAAVVATGATVILHVDDNRDQLTEDIVAYPHPGENGAYAYLDPDTSEIVIDVTADNDQTEAGGIPAGDVTVIDDVFVLENTGDDEAAVWIEHDAAAVEFHTGDGLIEGESASVVLGANETVAVGFTADATDAEANDRLLDGIEIHAAHAGEPKDAEDGTDGESAATPSDPGGQIEPACEPAQVQTITPSETVRTLSVTDVQTCKLERIDTDSLAIGQHVTIEQLTVDFAEDGDAEFVLNATHDDPVFDPVDDLHAETGAAPIGSVLVEEAPGSSAIDSQTHRLEIDRNWLDAEAIEPDDLTVHQYGDGEWIEADVDRVDAGDGESNVTIEHSVTVDQPSLVAIGVEAPVLTVEGLSVDPAEAEPGEAGTATVSISNHGDRDAVLDGRLMLDGASSGPLGTVSEPISAGDRVEQNIDFVVPDAETEQIVFEYEYTRAGGDTFVIDTGSVGASTELIEAVDAESETIDTDNPGEDGDEHEDSATDESRSDESGPDEPEETALLGAFGVPALVGLGLALVVSFVGIRRLRA